MNLAVLIRLVRNGAQARTIAVFQLAAATLLPHHLHIGVTTKIANAATAAAAVQEKMRQQRHCTL